MNSHYTFWTYFLQAGPVVKAVMLILLSISIASWTYIIQRAIYLKQAKALAKEFEQKFWAGSDLTKLYGYISQKGDQVQGLERIFHAGFSEFIRLRKQTEITSQAVMDGVQRAMRIAYAYETDQL